MAYKEKGCWKKEDTYLTWKRKVHMSMEKDGICTGKRMVYLLEKKGSFPGKGRPIALIFISFCAKGAMKMQTKKIHGYWIKRQTDRLRKETDRFREKISARVNIYSSIATSRQVVARARIFKHLWSPGIDSKKWILPAYSSLAGRYDNPIPHRFLAPIDCLKIPAPAACLPSSQIRRANSVDRIQGCGDGTQAHQFGPSYAGGKEERLDKWRGQNCMMADWRVVLFLGLEFFFCVFSFYVRYSTLLHLPPLRFHCVGGCWDRTKDSCDYSIGCQTL